MKGNPIAQNRFRYQTWSKDTDEPYESEWTETKDEAIKAAHRVLLREFTKFGVTDMVVKVFNEMNYKQKPIVITLEDAQKSTSQTYFIPEIKI